MTTEETKQQWAKLEPKLNKTYRGTAAGLFGESKAPFFDRGKGRFTFIDEFCRDEEVQLLTFEYVRELISAWGHVFLVRESSFLKRTLLVSPSVKP